MADAWSAYDNWAIFALFGEGKKMVKTSFLSLIVVLVAAATALAKTIYFGSEPGYVSLQAAIDDCNDGDTIVVAPGRYLANINFKGKAITVSSTDPAATIIDANGVGSVVTFANGEGPDSILAGFTITGGYGTANTSLGEDIYWGAGIYCYQASPTIKANIITGNNGPTEISGDEITKISYGGGIGCLESRAVISRNIIRDNDASAGAGIMAYMGNDRIANNLICHNSAEVGGGVILLNGGLLINNTVVANGAPEVGNVYAANVEGVETGKCLVLNNIICSAPNGGGIYYLGEPGEYDAITYNNIWNNAGGNYVEWSDQTGFNGNISQDPLFVSLASGDYHLQSESPCVNVGDPDFVPELNETDIDGEPRVFAVRVDIGADEYVGYVKPVADAGPDQHYKEIQLVILDGSGSYFHDPNGIKTFQWMQTAGPEVQLSDPTAAQPTFIPVSQAEYIFELVVSDGLNTSQPDEVLIVVGNRPPVADAGPNTICQVGERVYLDGTGSYDPDPGDELTYTWRQVQGPNVVLEDANTLF